MAIPGERVNQGWIYTVLGKMHTGRWQGDVLY
jgi:hypothetical protein